MQTVNVLAVVIQATALLTITTSAVPVVVKDILTTPGVKLREADTPAPVERFITSASRVRLQRQVRIQQLRLTTKAHDALLNIQQHGHHIAAQAVLISGMAIITFFVLYVEISAIQVQNGAQCIAAQVLRKRPVRHS